MQIKSKLGLIAGSGDLPKAVAEEAHVRGYEIIAVGLEPLAEKALALAVDEIKWINVGKLGALISFLKKSGVKVGTEKLDLSKLIFYNDEDGFMNLKFKLKTEGKTTIKIINETGKEVFVDKVHYFPGTYDKQTKVSLENEGYYYVLIEQNGKTNAFKVKFDR